MLELEEQSVAAGSVGFGSLLGQLGQGSSRQTFQPSQSSFEFAVLFGGVLVEGSGLWAKLHVDSFAFDLVSPFEVGAMPLGGIPVTGAVGLAAFHHALQDGPLEEIPQLLELLTSLAEARVGGAGEGGWRGMAGGHGYRFSRIILR